MYAAIIGDIVHSKDIRERKDAQDRLKAVLNWINSEYCEDISAKFIITLGDEFQGLLSSCSHILQIIDRIRFKLFPIRIRFGIGIGTIETDINEEMALGADGPAFYFARNMINYIKTAEKGKLSGSGNVMFYAQKDKEIIELINSNLQLCSFIEKNWTDKQRKLLEKVILEHKNQKESAIELGITQSSVQRRLKAAGYYDYSQAKTSLTHILQQKWGKMNE